MTATLPERLADHIGDGGLGYPFPVDDPEYGKYLAEAWSSGYEQGVLDGRAALEAEIAARCADVLVPVPTPWSLVRAGDVMRAPTGTLWLVWSIATRPDGMLAPLLLGPVRQYPPQGQSHPGVHPDERVPILVPMPENAALSALRDGLGEAHVRRLRGVQ